MNIVNAISTIIMSIALFRVALKETVNQTGPCAMEIFKYKLCAWFLVIDSVYMSRQCFLAVSHCYAEEEYI